MKQHFLLLFLGATAGVASAATPADPAVAPKWPPPGAYLGLEPNPAMPSESGERWYYQNVLLIEGGKIRLEKSPVICKNGEMSWSASDGGFFTYLGTAPLADDDHPVQLKLVSCDYCLEPWPVSIRRVRLPFARLSPQIVRLGSVTYTQGITQEQLVCPIR